MEHNVLISLPLSVLSFSAPPTDSVKQSGGRVLVHCQAGISRSATICLAYLIHTQRVKLDEAFDFVKQRRHVISPNLAFMGQLLQFETDVLCQGWRHRHIKQRDIYRTVTFLLLPLVGLTKSIIRSQTICTKMSTFKKCMICTFRESYLCCWHHMADISSSFRRNWDPDTSNCSW